jgi:putative intracellular protease/amidase
LPIFFYLPERALFLKSVDERLHGCVSNAFLLRKAFQDLADRRSPEFPVLFQNAGFGFRKTRLFHDLLSIPATLLQVPGCGDSSSREIHFLHKHDIVGLYSVVNISGYFTPITTKWSLPSMGDQAMDEIRKRRDAERAQKGKVLAIVSSHDKLGDTGYPTGYWISELSHPYLLLWRAGYDVDIASPKGGKAPVDAWSDPNHPVAQNPDDFISTGLIENKFHNQKLLNTKKLADINAAKYAGVWLVGGYGAAFEFADDPDIPRILQHVWNAGGVVGSICHGAPGLFNLKTADGAYLIKGKDLTGFSKAEDQEVEKVVGSHFLKYYVEDELRARGARYQRGELFQPFAVVSEDGRLVTGQQQFSGEVFGEKLLEALERPQSTSKTSGHAAA